MEVVMFDDELGMVTPVGASYATICLKQNVFSGV
jgi:hypothetical protein